MKQHISYFYNALLELVSWSLTSLFSTNMAISEMNVTLYCTWRPSGLTIGLHGQGYALCSKPHQAWCET